MNDKRKLWPSIIGAGIFVFLFVQCFHLWDFTPYYSVKAVAVLLGLVCSQTVTIQLLTVGDIIERRPSQ